MIQRLKVALAGAGILLALIALWRDDKRITWIAIGVLGAAVVVRMIARRRGPTGE